MVRLPRLALAEDEAARMMRSYASRRQIGTASPAASM